MHEVANSCILQVVTFFSFLYVGRLWKSYLKRQNVGEPEQKQWEPWAGKLAQEKMNAMTDAKIIFAFDV